ncbi:hypothetical protein PBI_TRIKE_38 [Mycobacterium phage Trike]|uniref:hypothetical protein n=1 Tax=Mycobacterium phage Trike TaxID=1527536 RepID=UPI0004EF8C8C|nr:hypothetical protein VC70_gp33 [Mycobacterium phage Trike]AIK69077.1 hypothetical protein PBI_TRIKE_38 [Mycobacterium phage Trike]
MMQVAQKAALLQPMSKLFLDWFGETDVFMTEARYKFEKLGEVVGNIEVQVLERPTIDGVVFPWSYELEDGTVLQIPDDFVMVRFEAFVVPKDES